MVYKIKLLILILSVWIAGSLWLAPQAAHALRLESGRATVNSTFGNPNFTRVNFQNTFDIIPVVTALATNEGGDPSALRIQNVTTTGFDIVMVEPDGSDGPHVAMTVDYIAAEPGYVTLPDGSILAAGRHTTASFQTSPAAGTSTGFDTVAFGPTLSTSASVIGSIQTLNSESGTPPATPSEPFLSVVIVNLTPTNMQLALERSEVALGTVVPEDIGWIALPNGGNGSFTDISSQTINWSAGTTSASITGFSEGCNQFTYTSTPFTTARVVATKNSRNGSDGGWLRRCDLNATQIGLVIDEDFSFDAERAHDGAEQASFIAFSGSFHANLLPTIAAEKTVIVEDDSLSGTGDDFALPGARIRYTIEVQNTGTAAINLDSLVFTDNLPPEIAMVVTPLSGSSTGPIRFNDGTPSSQLSLTFGGLSDGSDSIEFSNDGGVTFTYTPTPDGFGADEDITHIRIRPTGFFPGQGTSGTPSFTLEFDAIIL